MTGIMTRFNRIQDAAINWQETRYRRNADRMQTASLHRQRITLSDTVTLDTSRLDSQSQDWTGGMGMSPSGRFQVIESARGKQALVSKEGIRWNAAWIAICAVAVVCLGILLADLAGIGSGSRTMIRLDRKIAETAGKNEKMQAELALRDDDISVCTEAIKLDLISANGAQTIRLRTPVEARLTISSAYYPGE